MFNELLVGPQNLVGDGQVVKARGGRQGEQLASELHARYYEQTYRGNMYFAAIQAVATTTVGLATTYTGLVISNPITSVINMVLNKATIMQSVLQSTQVEAYAIATGYNGTTNVTHTTPLAVRTALVGTGKPGIGLADISATLPTAPFYTAFVHDTATATANGTGQVLDFEGSIILPPGGYALWVTPAQASVAGLWFSFSWEEVQS
jgi:hypothetical protein